MLPLLLMAKDIQATLTRFLIKGQKCVRAWKWKLKHSSCYTLSMMKMGLRKPNILQVAAVLLFAAGVLLGAELRAYAATDMQQTAAQAAQTAAVSDTSTSNVGKAAQGGNTAGSESAGAAGADYATEAQPTEHVTWESCVISGDNIVIKGRQDGKITDPNTGLGEDDKLWLLELAPYEDSIAGHRYISSVSKSDSVEFSIPYDKGDGSDRLYNRFVACVWTGKSYKIVSDAIYVTNPEAVATYKDAFKEPLTKKGLLVELPYISDAFSLGVHNVIVNIPFDSIIGEGIDYSYEGETYHFDKSVIAAYDKTIATYSNKSMNVTAVLLNRKTDKAPELIAPGTVDIDGINYYNFNAKTEVGYKHLSAIASFLASRYTGHNADIGQIHNWIVGNEINNQHWNYVGGSDIKDYVAEYERGFRVIYNAIKSQQANTRVYFSLDNNWNQGNDDKLIYTAKATLDTIAANISQHGNIDWGLAYHAYPVPSVEPEFWDDFETGQVTDNVSTTKVINFANLSLLTDYMQQESMLDRSGKVRHIILSEVGFSSQSPTRGKVWKEQAAAFAYAYYIADSNPYIDAFILTRQVDAPSETAASLALGLWTTEDKEGATPRPYTPKYIWDVFKHIDDYKTSLSYTEFAKSIIGISKWSDVIPNFRYGSSK